MGGTLFAWGRSASTGSTVPSMGIYRERILPHIIDPPVVLQSCRSGATRWLRA